jgi:hypothetical protein
MAPCQNHSAGSFSDVKNFQMLKMWENSTPNGGLYTVLRQYYTINTIVFKIKVLNMYSMRFNLL